MDSDNILANSRWQFSIRITLLAVAAVAVCLAIILFEYRRVQRRKFVEASVLPIVRNYVASVGYSNGRILWLRVNDIDPHHTNHVDQWTVPISMDMYINDGSFGPYRSFNNSALQIFVADHPHVRALDLRRSSVTDVGLRHLGKLKQLEWLWLDPNQATDSGLTHLHDMPALHTIGIDVNRIDPEGIRLRKHAIDDYRIVIKSNADPIPTSNSDEP